MDGNGSKQLNRFVSVGNAAKAFGVSTKTVRRWCDNQNVRYITNPSGQRRVDVLSGKTGKNASGEAIEQKEEIIFRKDICYCRVSSAKQKDDLERQISYMVDKYPRCTIVRDIGSGINFKRKGLLSILEQSQKGLVRSVTVSSKDRLCRFGFELIEWILKQNQVELLVLNKEDSTPEQELTRDILAIMQVFNSRWNGKRRYNLVTNNEV